MKAGFGEWKVLEKDAAGYRWRHKRIKFLVMIVLNAILEKQREH